MRNSDWSSDVCSSDLGGRRSKRDSAEYETLLRWVEAGVAYGSPELRVSRIQVEPADQLLSGTNQTVQLRVTAFLSDGTEQDVTKQIGRASCRERVCNNV